MVRCTARMTPPTEFLRTFGVGNRSTRIAAAVEHHRFDPYNGEIILDQGTPRGSLGRRKRGQEMLISSKTQEGEKQTHRTQTKRTGLRKYSTK